MFRACWKAFWAHRNGWLPGSVKLAGDPEAEPRERLRKPTAGSADDLGKQRRASSKFSYIVSTGATS